jgi:hypothetical protein
MRLLTRFGAGALATLVGAMLFFPASASAAPPIKAPELDGGVGWIGVDEPIHLKDLRGKIVVFDFWTLC